MPLFQNEPQIKKALSGILPIYTHPDIDRLYQTVSAALSGQACEPDQYVAIWITAIKGIWTADHFMVWYFVQLGWIDAMTEVLTAHWTAEEREPFYTAVKSELIDVAQSWRQYSL